MSTDLKTNWTGGLPPHGPFTSIPIGTCACGQPATMTISRGVRKGVWGPKKKVCNACFLLSL